MIKLLFTFTALFYLCSCSTQTFKAGYAEKEMDIPIGLRLCGTFTPRLGTGIHDPLRVYAHAFTQGKKSAVIVGCDVAMISPEVASKVRKRLEENPGISGDSVIIHASETHNAPDYFGEFREAFHKEAQLKNNGQDPAEKVDFAKILEDSVVDTVRAAYMSKENCSIKFGIGKAEGASFNRRFHMKDGSIGWNPGKGNPNIVEPAGPVDPEVPFIIIEQKQSQKRSILWGFAMHLALLGGESDYAADYPYFVSKHLNKHYPKAGTHFGQVPCCDVIHIDVNDPKPQKGYKWAEVVGRTLAESIIKAEFKSTKITNFELKSLSKIVKLRTKSYSPEEIKKASKKWMNPAIRKTLSFDEKIISATTTGIGLRYPGGKIPALIQVIQLSPEIAFVGLPGEVAVEFGLEIKKTSPYKHTHVIQLSNDWPGYIPTKKIFSGGQYEANVAKIRPGEGEVMTEEAIQLLQSLFEMNSQ